MGALRHQRSCLSDKGRHRLHESVDVMLDPNVNKPLSMQLAAAIKDSVICGNYNAGDVLPGIHELAAKNNTSIKVARRALELLAAEGWTRPQRGVGSVILDRGVGMREMGRVLMYVRDTGWGYYTARFVAALATRIRADGYGMITVSASGRSEREPCRRFEVMLAERWSLVLMMGGGSESLRLAVSSNWPFALVGDGAPLPTCTTPRCIGRVQILSGRALPDLIRACVRQKVRRIVQFVYAEGAFNVAPMLTEAGVLVETVHVTRRNFPEDVSLGAMRSMRKFLSKSDSMPDLFLFTDDCLAQGALLALLDAGVRIPQDVKVVTHSNRGLGPVWTMPLTRLEMDPVSHGRDVGDAIAGYLKTRAFPKDVILGSVWRPGATF